MPNHCLVIYALAAISVLVRGEFNFQTRDCLSAKALAVRPGYAGPDPTCDSAGVWAPKQCWASRNQCWCVDMAGQEIQPKGSTTHKPWGTVKDCNAYRNGQIGINQLYGPLQQQCPTIDIYEVCSDNIDRCSETSCGLSQRCCQTKCRRECRTVVGVGSVITPTGSRVQGCQTTSCPFGQSCVATTGTCENGHTCTKYECKASFNSECPPSYSLVSSSGPVCSNDVNCRLAANERCCPTSDGRNNVCVGIETSGFSATLHPGSCPPSTSIAASGNLCTDDRSCGSVQKCCLSLSNNRVCTPAVDSNSASEPDFPTRFDVGDFQPDACPKPNEVWSATRGHCRVTCAQIVGAGTVSPSCPETRLAGCICQDGYYAAENGDCVTKSQCEQSTAQSFGDFHPNNDLRCEINEVWSVDHGSCHITCAQVVSGADPACPGVDGPGCVCQPGYARANNGRCIPIEACGLTVGTQISAASNPPGFEACFRSEEVWSTKHGNCDVLCDQVRSGASVPACFGEKPPRCVCRPGYARKPDGSCIPQHKCGGVSTEAATVATTDGQSSISANRRDDSIPHPSQDKFKSIIQSQPNDLCNDSNEKWDVTNGTCHLTCEHVRKTQNLECYDAPKAGCVCRDGFVKENSDGKCVPVSQCYQDKEKVVVDNCYGSYEERRLGCGLACELTCADRLAGRNQPSCSTQTCAPRCECKPGSIRSVLGGECVLDYQCTSNSPGGSLGVPSAQNCPSANEALVSCKQDCELTCEQLVNNTVAPSSNSCPTSGTCQAGCFCTPGHYRERAGGSCITELECRQAKSTSFTNFKCVAPNTVMTTCSAHPDCQATCQRPSPEPGCAASRCLSGCVCRVGYVRRSENSDQCILQSQCGLPTSGDGVGGLLGRNVRKAVAVFKDSDRGITGTVYFDQLNPNEIRVSGTIQGIPPRGTHGFHIHRKGDITGSCSLIAEHFNPKNSQIHGGPTSSFRHVGDLGNIEADANGVSNINMQDRQLTLNGPESIVGRALVVSANVDDLGRGGTSQSTIDGNSGPPLACAVIGIDTDY